MRILIRFSRICVALLAFCAMLAAADFTWDWHSQEVIGRGDTSVGNTSKLTESRRTELMQALVLRLQKSMSEKGYDDDRIREVASTTRLRFVDLGDGRPVIMATSLGMEGGCDSLVNCPFWIFRHAEDGYVALLEADAASYTVQPTKTNGLSDLVISRHVTATESKLTLYQYADDKYSDAGCYTATWPAAKDGEVQAPEIAPCKADNADSKPDSADGKPDKAESKPDKAESKPGNPDSKPDNPDSKPDNADSKP